MTGRSMVAMSWQVLLRLSHDGSIAAFARGNGSGPCLEARNGGKATASSEGQIRHRSRRRSWSPTHVGGGEPRRGVRSRREAALVARAQARSGHADPAHDDWSGDRTRPQTWHVAGGALDALVCRTGDRDHGAPALRAAAISVRGTAYWLLAVGLSFVDGRLIPYLTTVMVLGMAASFLLGNLRDASRAWVGLAIVLGGAAIIVYNKPAHSTSELIFIPLLFGIGWLGGYALRERSQQAEAADVRATQAEWERDAAARIAVAEERARIARELHDIVAHAVSVMVLQVGAVRHRLPDALVEDREALQGVEQVGRTALTEMRRLLAAMRRDGDEAELIPQPGLESLDSLAEAIGRAGLPVRLHVDGQPSPLPRAIDLSAYRIAQEGPMR